MAAGKLCWFWATPSTKKYYPYHTIWSKSSIRNVYIYIKLNRVVSDDTTSCLVVSGMVDTSFDSSSSTSNFCCLQPVPFIHHLIEFSKFLVAHLC